MRTLIRPWLPLILILGIVLAAIQAHTTLAKAESASPYLLSRALRQGDHGERISELQRLLHAAGFDPGEVDGLFGPRTDAAVRQAQASLGLAADGLAGDQTRSALAQAGNGESESARSVLGTHLVIHEAKESTDLAPNLNFEDVSVAAIPFALTFNGALDPELTPRLLTILKRDHMRATFFLTGQMIQRMPELVAQIVADGHEIGNNGWNDRPIAGLTREMAQAELIRTQQVIEQLVGRAPQFFRPPQGVFDQELVAAAAQLNLTMAMWTNVTVKPLPQIEPPQMARKLQEVVFPGAVIMLHHDGLDDVKTVELLLSNLRLTGYRSLILSELAPLH